MGAIHALVTTLCEHYDLPEDSIVGYGATRSELAVEARDLLIVALHCLDIGVSDIGRFVGRDHTSVIASLRRSKHRLRRRSALYGSAYVEVMKLVERSKEWKQLEKPRRSVSA